MCRDIPKHIRQNSIEEAKWEQTEITKMVREPKKKYYYYFFNHLWQIVFSLILERAEGRRRGKGKEERERETEKH